MRLKTKLVVAASGVTFAIVLTLSLSFLGELLHQRIEQTAASNDVLAREVLLMTRQAVESGLRAHPPADRSDEAFNAAVSDALRSDDALSQLMNGIVRYSPAVQDVSVTDAHSWTLVSTDPQMWNQLAMSRTAFVRLRDSRSISQAQQMLDKGRVYDVSQPLDRNGKPFLVVHVGVRSSFLKASYEPLLRSAGLFALLAGLASMVAAGLLANSALQPIESISRQLEQLTSYGYAEPQVMELPSGRNRVLALPAGLRGDAVGRVNRTIYELGRQIRTTEEGYTALQSNLNQVLDTLRDGVVLFTAERRAVMVSDSVANFVDIAGQPMVGQTLDEIFGRKTALGEAVHEAFAKGEPVTAQTVTLEDGRQVQISLDPIHSGGSDFSGNRMGALLTLRDIQSVLQIEQELEISRRLAAIGRLTAGVGHEVKNPINAMVVHLELLKSKLAAGSDLAGAQRHADILAGEMQRLDRVVQTLADFSRPMELHLKERDLGQIANAVLALTGHELAENRVTVQLDESAELLCVRVDAELIRQALLNLVLNAMQAMPEGGELRIVLRREHGFAVVEVADQGEGIAPELMPRIFELYFTTKAKGSGIGLAMTYRILQMHGGALDVRSNVESDSPDRGTTFTLRLPLVNLHGSRSLGETVAGLER